MPGKRVLWVTLVVALVTLITLALRSQPFSPVFLHITAMQVYGELRWVDRQGLNETVQPYLNSNFFSADLEGIKLSVEALPWVASASVRRQWPNQLHIAIFEHRAVARWKDNILVNDKGELFQPQEIPLSLEQSLVQLQGPDNSHQELFALYQELQPLFAGNMSNSEPGNESATNGLAIVKVFLNERRALGIELSNGMLVMFGRMSASMDLYNAAARFFQAYDNSLKDQAAQIAVVDLRYTNGFAVQWKDSSNIKN